MSLAAGACGTWSVLAVEIGFPVLCLSRRGRVLAWTLAAGMHVLVLVLLDIADLTVPMLLFHLLVFGPRWLPSRR